MEKIYIDFDVDVCEMKDIASLRTLLRDNDYNVEEQFESKPGEMGTVTTCFVLLLPFLPKVIEEIASIVKTWLPNRRVKLKVENKEKGYSFEIDSASGKLPSQEELVKFFSLVTGTDGNTASMPK